MNIKITLVLFLLIVSKQFCEAQEENPEILIERINKKFLKVHDYQAKAIIDARISFLKILPQKAHLYFQQPDRFKIKSEGIAILPKQRFDNLFSLLVKKDSYTAFPGGTDIINGHTVTILNIIPLADTSDLILAKIWADPAASLVLKAQLTTKSNGTVGVEYEYADKADFSLPAKIIFTVELKKFKIPKALAADINSPTAKSDKGKEPKTGRIIVTLTDYIINKGIANGIFEK